MFTRFANIPATPAAQKATGAVCAMAGATVVGSLSHGTNANLAGGPG